MVEKEAHHQVGLGVIVRINSYGCCNGTVGSTTQRVVGLHHSSDKEAFQFLSADVRKPHKQPFSLNTNAAQTGENRGKVAGCSKTEMHSLDKHMAFFLDIDSRVSFHSVQN
jgi:hypothetical protein